MPTNLQLSRSNCSLEESGPCYIYATKGAPLTYRSLETHHKDAAWQIRILT